MAQNNITLLYITAPNKVEAEKICQSLLENKLIACANIFSPITSMYQWENTLHKENEVAFLIKTTQQHTSAVQDFIQKYHSYDCPCIIELTPKSINSIYKNWLIKSVSQETTT